MCGPPPLWGSAGICESINCPSEDAAILSRELAAAANTPQLRPHAAPVLSTVLSVLLSEWQIVTFFQMLQLSCSSDVYTVHQGYSCQETLHTDQVRASPCWLTVASAVPRWRC